MNYNSLYFYLGEIKIIFSGKGGNETLPLFLF